MNKANYIGLAYQFFDLVKEAITEMELQGNRNLLISAVSKNDQKSWQKYEDATCWNDFKIGVPVLFNFYHGLELLMKGLLQEVGYKDEVYIHDLSILNSKLREPIYTIPKNITAILEKYISAQNPFQDFFDQNSATPSNFYEYLKYPETKKNQRIKFTAIRGNEKKGLDRFLNVKSDIINLRQSIINWKMK